MLRQVLAVAVLMLAVGHAQAQSPAVAPITNGQECIAVVETLAQSWENHKYASKADRDKVGQALKQLEAQCEGEKYADAQKLASDLKSQIAH